MGSFKILRRIWVFISHADTTISLFTWFGAMGALIAAAIAFLRGLDPIWWFVIGLVVFVALLVGIVLVVALLDRREAKKARKAEQNKQPKEPETIDAGKQTPRIPMIEFCEIAIRNGWLLYGESTFYKDDLIAEGLRQASLDGFIQVWGQKGPVSKSTVGQRVLLERLEEIPKEYWKNYKIEPMTCIYHQGSIPGDSGDNRRVTTNSLTHIPEPQIFHDIYLDEKQAMEWLKRDSFAFMGKTEKRRNQNVALQKQQRMNWVPSARCIKGLKEWLPENSFVEITRHDKHSFGPAQRLEHAFKEAGWENVQFDQDILVGSPHYKVGIEIQGVSRTLVEGIITILEEDGLPEITDNVDENHFKDRGMLRIRVGIE